MADTVPAETLHALLRDYATARWPNADADHEAVNLAADPIYGGDPELVHLAAAAYALGRASVLDALHSQYRMVTASGTWPWSDTAAAARAIARYDPDPNPHLERRLVTEPRSVEGDRG